MEKGDDDFQMNPPVALVKEKYVENTSCIFLNQYDRLLYDSRLVTSYINNIPMAPR